MRAPTGRSTQLAMPMLAIFAAVFLLGSSPRAAYAADLDNGDFVVGVLVPHPFANLGGKIIRIRNGVSTDFCSSTPTPYTNGFFQTPAEVVLDDQGRVVFLAQLGVGVVGYGDGWGLWRCDSLGATPTMLGAFGGGAGLGYPEPVGGAAVCHAVGLHMKRFQGVDLNNGTASSSNLYVFAINTACGTGPFETIAFNPASGQWLEDFPDPVPTVVRGPNTGTQFDMINTGTYTFSVGDGGIRGVIEPLSISFDVAGVASGGLVLQRITDLGRASVSPDLLWDDLTSPNVDECSSPAHSGDGIPIGTPYNRAGGLARPDPELVAWRDGGLLLQPGEGTAQSPDITNLALFNLDPGDDKSSMAHHGLANCSHVNVLQYTPWHAYNDYFDPSGTARTVREWDPSGHFGTQYGQVIGVGPGLNVSVYATGLLDAVGIDVYPPFVPAAGGVAIFFKIESPIDVLITASDGRRLGADLVTGAPINDFGAAGYDSQTLEPHIYAIRDPVPGPIAIETKGTGVGPYHVTVYGANLGTDVVTQASFSGNASLGSASTHGAAISSGGVVIADADADGVDDALDNCAFAPNPLQEDRGGLGAAAPPNGRGDACECGDVTGNGRVTTADAITITRSLLVPPIATLAQPQLCDVGGSTGCSSADAIIVTRALLVPATAQLSEVCAPALP